MTVAVRRPAWAERHGWAGVGLVLLYAAVAVATNALADGRGRPLFDGFAPQPPYRWVNPPPEMARDNMPPESAERVVPLGEAGNEPANASTPDAQIVVGLPRGAIPSHPPETAVALRIEPRDASQLGPVPPDLRIVTNAYQISLAYEPSRQPVTEAATGATVAMTAASQGDTMLYSTDGQQWRVLRSRPFGATHGVLDGFEGPGYYLVAASPAVTATTTTLRSAEGGGSGSFAAALVVAGAAAVIGAGVVMWQRRRQAAAAEAAAKAAAAKGGARRKRRGP